MSDVMQRVIMQKGGTAFSAFKNSPIRKVVYGKTGTAQIKGERSHKIFVAFYKNQGEIYTVCCAIEHAEGLYNQAAVNTVRKILEEIARTAEK